MPVDIYLYKLVKHITTVKSDCLLIHFKQGMIVFLSFKKDSTSTLLGLGSMVGKHVPLKLRFKNLLYSENEELYIQNASVKFK